MSKHFRELLQKIGSGPHTSQDLSRAEAAAATQMMLLQEATPAQIGAFMIAHRIKRPTGAELAGMLDAYEQLGPRLAAIASPHPVAVFGIPYDGRSRTAPLLPLTALVLATAGCPVLLQGGERMPTKYGIPLIEVWQGLGIDWRGLDLTQLQTVLADTCLGFLYTPRHFPLMENLIPYRDQIGKRPPFATIELIWSAYAGEQHLIAGFVHPPTEDRFREALALRETTRFMTVKGLEGSCDLPRDRTGIIGKNSPNLPFERILLHPRDYGFAGTELPLTTPEELISHLQSVLQGKPSEWLQAVVWNSGFYLHHCGFAPDLPSGFAQAEALLTSEQVLRQLQLINHAVMGQKA